MLVLLDQLLAVAGAFILIVWAVGYRFRSGGLPIGQTGIREDAIIIAAGAYFVAAMLLAALMQAGGVAPESVWAGMMINNGAQLCGVAACAGVAIRRVPGGIRTFFLGTPKTNSGRANVVLLSLAILLVGVGVCPVIRDLTVWLIVSIAPHYSPQEHPTLKALEGGGLNRWEITGLWIGAGAIAPLAEEMFFRGLLQSFLADSTKRTGLAVALCSLAFGLVHISQPHAVPALVFLGVLLGWAYARSGMLIVPVAIHAAFNLKTLIWEAMERSGVSV